MLQMIGNSVNASMATTTGGGGDTGGGDTGGGGGGGGGGTVSGDQTFGEWDFADNNTFAPTANMSPTDNVAGGYYGSNFLNTPDYDISSDVVSGQGNIMGYWGEGGSASDLSNIEVGEITQSLIDISSASSSAYGNSETVGTVEYPAFLVNAANGQNPELMRISGGDPFAWWESLSGNSKSMFMNRYGDEVVSMNDATSDVYRRNANGEITDFLMPEWMALQLGEAGKGLDHKAWSHLSAKERDSLQDKASVGNLNTELISITSNVNTRNPTIAQFDTAAGEGFIFEDINEMPEGGATSRQPQQIEEMTYGQFMQTMLANGMDFSGYSGKDANMPMSDGFAYEVSEMAQLGDADHRGYRGGGLSQGGMDWTQEKGKEGNNYTEQGTFIPPEMVAYFADHIDEYMTLMGIDPHSGILSEAAQGGGTEAEFGSAYRLVQDTDEDGRAIPGSFTKEAIDNGGMAALDRMLSEYSMDAYVNDVNQGDEIDDAQVINWAEFIGGTDRARDIWDNVSDLEEGKSWGGIQSDDNYSNPEIYSGGPGAGHGGGRITTGAHVDSEGSSDYALGWVMDGHWGAGNYSMVMDQEFGGGYNALNEISMQITPLYQAYKNWVSDQNAKPISVTSKEDWWDIYTGAQPQGAYDETPQEKINRMEGQNAGAEQAWASYLAGIDTSNMDDLAYHYDLWSGANEDSLGYTESHYGVLPTDYAYGGTVQSHASNGLGHYFGGGYVDGSSGGMDDTVPAVTDGMEPAKLSSGEFVIPADVVSHLGDGNNDNGASKLHDMMNRIRTFKTGNAQQPAPVDDTWVMPS